MRNRLKRLYCFRMFSCARLHKPSKIFKKLPPRPAGMKEVTSQMKKFEWLRAKVWGQGFSSGTLPPPTYRHAEGESSPTDI